MLVSPTKWLFWDIPTHAESSFQYLQEHSLAVLKALGAKTDGYTGTEGLRSVKADRFGLHTVLDEAEDSDPEFITPPQSLSELAKSNRPVDILSFHCIFSKRPGRLIISVEGLRFRSSIPHKLTTHSVDFSYLFTQLDEMRKSTPKSSVLATKAGITAGLARLELRFRDGAHENTVTMDSKAQTTRIMLESMTREDRDRAFNAILGFSGEIWQNLQSGWGQ